MRAWIQSLFAPKTHAARRTRTRLGVESMEERLNPGGGTWADDAPVGVSGIKNTLGSVVITGTTRDDVADVRFVRAFDGSVVVAVTLNGQRATYDAGAVSRVTFLGDAGNDRFTNSTGIYTYAVGGADNDTLTGGNGGNRLEGGAGDDILVGGPQVDSIYGNTGNDKIYGNGGNDALWGRDGEVDTGVLAFGESDDDTIDGGAGNDKIEGQVGSDWLYGGIDNDSIWGGPGADNLYDNEGNDYLDGEEGNDGLYAGVGRNYVRGGPGTDRFLERRNLVNDSSSPLYVWGDSTDCRVGRAGALN